MYVGKSYVRKKIKDYDNTMSELFADCEHRMVDSFDGTKIAYRIIGEGLPLIVSPGVFTTYMFFHYLKDYFSSRHQVILWDYRGHPESHVPLDLETVNMQSHARDLKAVMDDVGIKKAIHIGFSMGVMVILEFYHQFPEMVLGLIPIDGPYAEGFSFVSESKLVQDAISEGLDFLSRHIWLLEWLKPILVLPINVPIAKRVEINPTMCPEREMKMYFEHITKMDWHVGIKALSTMAAYNGDAILDDVKVPTLLIAGEKDTWTPRRIADEMHRRIRGSEFSSIPGGSHATPAENPQMVNFRIDLFLRTHFHEMVEKPFTGFSSTEASMEMTEGSLLESTGVRE